MNAYFSKITLAAALVAGSVGLAQAQMAPNDMGTGAQRGATALRQSGEVGTVTLFDRGPNATLVVLNVQQAPNHPQPAALQRAQSCRQIEPQVAFPLNDVVGGHSSTIVNVSKDRLLSGNYAAIVHANHADPTWYVNCGHLYR
ncbi:MAG TPA: hypothetical protein VN905_05760 [Candidatus Binatia bacterium]|nr:hypothetical protein [Candidatus Binatia bacterium]